MFWRQAKRDRILRLLEVARGPLSGLQIVRITGIGRGLIYLDLNALCDQGKIIRTTASNGNFLFERRYD